MAEVSSFLCQCGERFRGPEAVKHCSKCEVRREKSRLHAVCTELRSEDPHALAIELIAEVSISCNDQLTSELVQTLLQENERHHGRFVNKQDDSSQPSPLLVAEEEKQTQSCTICGASKSETLTLGCAHIVCEVHYCLLLAKNKCEFPTCEHKLTPEEIAAIKQSIGAVSPKPEFPEDKMQCSLCGEYQPMNAVLFLDCIHTLCREHIVAAFEEQYPKTSTVQCPVKDCAYLLNSPEIEAVVGVEKLEEADTAAALKLVKEMSSVMLVTCAKCGLSAGLEKGKIDFNFKDARGVKINEEAAVYMSKHRFRCPGCSSTICATCGVTPYHDAYTCDSYRLVASLPLCRSCRKPLVSETCTEEECVNRSRSTCAKALPCGHACNGVKDEVICPPCLTCSGKEQDICIICHCEDLSAAPIVSLKCQHLLHHHCLESVLERRWQGPRITFKFAMCPACNAWIQSDSLPELSARVQVFKELRALVKEKALKRLEFEKEDQLPRLSDPGDPYFQHPARYAIDRFCYYECFKCKRPYFGGKRDCQLQDQERVYNPEELVCAQCVSFQGGEGVCQKHGEDFVQYKCKYCCDLAVWFCWGTTHFCEPCHNIWEQRRDASKEELPQCPGMPGCPLQVKHPMNGEEFCLGCAACREELDKQHQDF